MPNFKIQISNEIQIPKLESETSSEWQPSHAALLSASNLSLGFVLLFEL